jgi:cytochrome P450
MQTLSDAELSLYRVLDSDVLANPNPFYRTLREHKPVHWDPYMHTWVVTSYAEVMTVLKTCSAARAPSLESLRELGLPLVEPLAGVMLQQMMFMDGAMHARLRNICSTAFTKRSLEELTGFIEKLSDELIDQVIESGYMDVLSDFANPMPAIVTAKLLGVPLEDHPQLRSWANDVAEWLGNLQLHPDRAVQSARSLDNLKQYFVETLKEQRRVPRSGLIHSLMTAEVEGERLTDEQIIANAIITLIGGHETTTNLIASGFLTLLREPKSFEHMRLSPETVTSAVEELLRFESPVQHTVRIAPENIMLGGKAIQKGTKIVVVLAAANRDPNRFPDPDCLDLMRSDNRHLAFGWAGHFCFGAPLARLEAKIAFNKLLRRVARPILNGNSWEWRHNAGLRGLVALPIRFDSQHLSAGARS